MLKVPISVCVLPFPLPSSGSTSREFLPCNAWCDLNPLTPQCHSEAKESVCILIQESDPACTKGRLHRHLGPVVKSKHTSRCLGFPSHCPSSVWHSTNSTRKHKALASKQDGMQNWKSWLYGTPMNMCADCSVKTNESFTFWEAEPLSEQFCAFTHPMLNITLPFHKTASHFISEKPLKYLSKVGRGGGQEDTTNSTAPDVPCRLHTQQTA